MTPEAAVEKLSQLVSARTEFTEEEIYTAMTDAGIPDPVADRAYKFTQVAWGRVFLDGLGVRFADDYLCFDGDGNIVESGALVDQPYYSAAMTTAKDYFGTKGTLTLALMSAEVSTVNQMLNNGSRAEDLETSPPALFLEAPTAAGIEKARQQLSRRLRKQSHPVAEPTPKKKPWWQPW